MTDINVKKHLGLLGLTAVDKVTGFRGVVASVSFDLYGCLQVWVTPKVGKDGKPADGGWYDAKRLTVSGKPCMELPNFDSVPGPEAKGAPHS